MPVFDPRQGQVLFSPVTNYYQGKAIRQEQADREQMAEMRDLQIDEAKYQQSPERRAKQEELAEMQIEAARVGLNQAEITYGKDKMGYLAKSMAPIMESITPLLMSGDEEGAIAQFNEQVNALLPTMPKDLQKAVLESGGADHVYDMNEIADTATILHAWQEQNDVDYKETEFMLDGKPVKGSFWGGNYYLPGGKLAVGDIQPIDKSPTVSIKNVPPDELRKPQMLDFFEKGSEKAENDLVAVRAADNMLAAIDDGIISGIGANIKEQGVRVFSLMGDKENPPEVLAEAIQQLENSQYYDTQGGILVGQIIRLFGSGTGLSDADREYAQKIAGALRTNEEGSLKRVLEDLRKDKMKNVMSWNNKVNIIAENDPRFADAYKVGETEAKIEALLEEARNQ